MTKPTTKKVAKAQPKPIVVRANSKDEPIEAAVARFVLRPSVNAAMTVKDYKIIGLDVDVDLNDLAEELRKQCDAAVGGDLRRAEAMLIAQAHSLDMIFTNLARRAFLNFGEYLDSAERYMRLALKAQSQCRATLETLSAVKNPPVVIAKQANVTSGPQQINNGLAREIQSEPNKLLEQSNGKWLDGGAAGQASGSHQAMETVGAIDRPEVAGGEKP